MKQIQIVRNSVKVALFIIVYLLVRFAVSLFQEEPACGWDVSAILISILALAIFAIYYSVKPEKSTFISWQFFLFFAAGSLFWFPEGLARYSLLVAIAVFFFLFLISLFSTVKSIVKGENEEIEKIGHFLLICSIYILILPAVALGEMFF
jgi:hypothetical protein